MAYQPQQNLTWIYTNSTGQLSIAALINVTDLTATLHLNSSAGPVTSGKCDIRIDVVNGSYNSPITVIVNYLNIGAGLQTGSRVRDRIANISMVTVNSAVYVDGTKKGESTGATTITSEIIIN